MSLYCSPELFASWFQIRFKKKYYESMGANDPHGEASLDPRVMVSRILCMSTCKALQYTFTNI